jgi:hypothetical protein
VHHVACALAIAADYCYMYMCAHSHICVCSACAYAPLLPILSARACRTVARLSELSHSSWVGTTERAASHFQVPHSYISCHCGMHLYTGVLSTGCEFLLDLGPGCAIIASTSRSRSSNNSRLSSSGSESTLTSAHVDPRSALHNGTVSPELEFTRARALACVRGLA